MVVIMRLEPNDNQNSLIMIVFNQLSEISPLDTL